MLLLLFIVGCTTCTTTFETYDKEGNIVNRTVTEEQDAIGKMMQSIEHKTWGAWSTGWKGSLSIQMTGTKNPLPNVDITAGKIDNGIFFIHKDQQNIDKIPAVIKAMKTKLKVTQEGFGEE